MEADTPTHQDVYIWWDLPSWVQVLPFLSPVPLNHHYPSRACLFCKKRLEDPASTVAKYPPPDSSPPNSAFGLFLCQTLRVPHGFSLLLGLSGLPVFSLSLGPGLCPFSFFLHCWNSLNTAAWLMRPFQPDPTLLPPCPAFPAGASYSAPHCSPGSNS